MHTKNLLTCLGFFIVNYSVAFLHQHIPVMSNGYLESIEKPPSNPYLDRLERTGRRRSSPIVLKTRSRYSEDRKRLPTPNVFPSNDEDDTSVYLPVPILRMFLNSSRKAENTPRMSKRSSSKSSDNGMFVLENIDVAIHNFTRVGGYDDVKQQLHQILDFMRSPENYTQYGIRIPKGVMLEGPTGNGKTLLARCFAGEANMNFISTSGSEFTEKYVGVGASRVRELFDFACENQPCIIFIDEMDAIGRSRSSEAEASGAERDQTLNQLLVMMDGCSIVENVVVMGATNRIDILDKALLRPGRFDKIIHVPNPDAETRKRIIGIHAVNKPLNVTSDYLIELSNGLNGAQIENLLNEAVLDGIRHRKIPIDIETIEIVREKILMGQSAMKGKEMSVDAQRRIAIHEVGHLLLALESAYYDRPWKVTIDSVNPSHSLGYTIFQQKDNNNGLYTREYFHDRMKVLLGGRIAEEIFYGDSTSSGALSDLQGTLALASKMILEYGMGKERIYHATSDAYKRRVDDEVHSLISIASQQAHKFLSQNKALIEIFVDVLMQKKKLYKDEILQIWSDHATV